MPINWLNVICKKTWCKFHKAKALKLFTTTWEQNWLSIYAYRSKQDNSRSEFGLNLTLNEWGPWILDLKVHNLNYPVFKPWRAEILVQNTYLHPKMFLSLTDPPAHHDCSLDARILAGVHDETMSRPERGGPLSCANLARLPGKKWCVLY